MVIMNSTKRGKVEILEHFFEIVTFSITKKKAAPLAPP